MNAIFEEGDVGERGGGKVFAVLLSSTDLEAALGAANRLVPMLAARLIGFDGARSHYIVCGGVAAVEGGAATLGALIKPAIDALYATKCAGRNQIALWQLNSQGLQDRP